MFNAIESFLEGIVGFASRLLRTTLLVFLLPFSLHRLGLETYVKSDRVVSPKVFAFVSSILLVPTIAYFLQTALFLALPEGPVSDWKSLLTSYKVVSLEDSLLKSAPVLLFIYLVACALKFKFRSDSLKTQAAYDYTTYAFSSVAIWLLIPMLISSYSFFTGWRGSQLTDVVFNVLLFLPFVLPATTFAILVHRLRSVRSSVAGTWARFSANLVLGLVLALLIPLFATATFFVRRLWLEPPPVAHIHVLEAIGPEYGILHLDKRERETQFRPSQITFALAVRNYTNEPLGIDPWSFQMTPVFEQEPEEPIVIELTPVSQSKTEVFLDPNSVMVFELKMGEEMAQLLIDTWKRQSEQDRTFFEYVFSVSTRVNESFLQKQDGFNLGCSERHLFDSPYVAHIVESQPHPLSVMSGDE